MQTSSLQKVLPLLEKQVVRISVALLEADPRKLEDEALHLRDMSRELHALITPGSNGFGVSNAVHAMPAERVKMLAENLAAVREGLQRRAVFVEQSLQSLLPAAQTKNYASGYAPANGSSGSGFGHPARQSGAFGVLAA